MPTLFSDWVHLTGQWFWKGETKKLIENLILICSQQVLKNGHFTKTMSTFSMALMSNSHVRGSAWRVSIALSAVVVVVIVAVRAINMFPFPFSDIELLCRAHRQLKTAPSHTHTHTRSDILLFSSHLNEIHCVRTETHRPGLLLFPIALDNWMMASI